MEVEPTRAGFGRYLWKHEIQPNLGTSDSADRHRNCGDSSLAVLQQILGHASIVTTKRYAGISDDMVRREAGGLEMVTF